MYSAVPSLSNDLFTKGRPRDHYGVFVSSTRDENTKRTKLVYLNGNNAAEGENNIKYASSYPMN